MSATEAAGPPRRSADRGWTLALFAVLLLGGLWLGAHVDFQHQWDNDEGIWALQGRAIRDGQVPYVDFWFNQPPGLPYALALAFRVAGATVPVARWLCLLLAFVGVAAVGLLARRLAGGPAGLAAAALLVLSPHFWWLARSINPDVPSMALATAGLALVWRWRDGAGGASTMFSAGLLVGLGLSLKLTGGLVLLPVGLLCLVRAVEIRRAEGGWPPAIRSVAVAGAWLALGTGAVVATWFLTAPPASVWQGTIASYFDARDIYANRSAEYADWLLRENLLGENLGLSVLAVFGLFALGRRRRPDSLVLAAWLALTCLAIVGQRPMWPKHHLSLVLWPLAVLAGIGVGELLALTRQPRDRRWRVWAAAGGAALVLWLVTLPRTATRLRDELHVRPFSAGLEAVTWLNAHTAPDDAIVTDNGLIAFRTGRSVPASMITLASKRIRLGEVSDEDIIAAAEDERTQAVLLWNDQLTDFKRFLAWLPTHYVHIRDVGEGRRIWQRIDGLTPLLEGTRFDDVATLERYGVPQASARAGEDVVLRLGWRARAPSATPLSVFVHLVGPDGQPVAQADGFPGGAATEAWTPGQLAYDERVLSLPVDAAPGEYRFVVGVYDPATGERLPALRPDGARAAGDAVGLEPPVVVAQ